MALSDKYNFNVGDRVRDRQSGEEGRVVDIARLADGALLLTVATFVGLAIRRKYQTVIRPGQTSGTLIEKIVSAVTRSEKVTAPTAATSVSQSAVQQALRNRSTDPDELTKFIDSIKGRTFHGKDVTILEKARKAYNPVVHDATLRKLTDIQREVLQINGELGNRPGMMSRTPFDNVTAPHPDPQVRAMVARKSQLLREARGIKKTLSDTAKEFSPLKVVGEAGGRGRTAARLFDTSMAQDIEGWAESIYGQLRRIRGTEDLLRRRQQQIDTSLDWLLNPGRKGPDKQWTGGYLRDVILRGGKTLRPADIAKEEYLAQMLSRVTITDEFQRKNMYRYSFNMAKRGTALELLQDMRANLQGLSYKEQSEMWRTRFAPLLAEAVRTGKPYTRLNRNVSRLGNLRQAIHGDINAFANDPALERLNPFLEVGESVASRGVRIDSEVLQGLTPRGGGFSGQEEFRARYGYEVGTVDIDMGDVWAANRRHRMSPIGTQKVSDVQIETARARISAINTRVTPHNIFTEAGREGLLGTRNNPLNSFVEVGGVPFRVKDVLLESSERESRRVILQAVNQQRELFAPLQFFGDEPLWNVVDQIATSKTRLPEIQGPGSMPINIALRGGLRGATDDLVNIPTNLLFQFMSGQDVNVSAQELSRLGFRTRAEFTEQLGFARKQMTRTLRETMPIERLRGLAPRMISEEEFLQEAWQFLPDIIRQSEQGQYIHDVRTAAARGAWERVEERFKVLGRDFSEAEKNLVDIFFKDDEGNLVLRESSRGMEFARSQNYQEIAAQRQFLTTSEYYGKVAAFENRLITDARSVAAQAVAGKSRVTSDSEKLYTAFEKTFGRVGNEETQRLLAEELQLTLQFYRKSGPAEDVAMYKQEIRDLAAQMNIELVTESPELRVIRARWNITKKKVKALKDKMKNMPGESPELQARLEVAVEHSKRVGRAYGAMKADEVAAFQAATVSKRVLSGEAGTLSRGVGWAREFAAINQENQAQASTLFNALIGIAEQEGLEGRLKPIQGAFHPMAGGRFGIVLHGGSEGQGRFIYRPLTIEGTPGGFSFAENNPANITLFGHDPNLNLGISQVEDLVRQGAWRHVSNKEAFILERNIVRASTDVSLDITNRQLPIFRGPGGQGVGIYAGRDVALETLAENTRQIFSGGQFLSVDIETSMDRARIYNISVAHNMGMGAGFAEGKELDLATPEFWASHGMKEQADIIRQHLAEGRTLSEELRTFTKNGQSTIISEIVADEQEMLARAKQFIFARSNMPIVGHNVGFDVGILAERFGAPAMRQRMADTILAAQVAHPEATEFSLEALHKRFGGVGSDWKEAHVARPDRLVMLERIKDMAMGKGVVEGLTNLDTMNIAEGQLLWNKSRGGGRAYRFEGIIDPEQARAAFKAQTGGDVNFGFGIAMRPIDFLTGEAGDLEVSYQKTPHGFARMFASNFDILDEAEAKGNMRGVVDDLARRRIRRITGEEKDTFSRLLLERERFALAQRVGENPTAAMAELATRHIAASTEAEKKTTGMLQRWAERFLPDSRIRAQLSQQAEFWSKEMPQHEPVVGWLESQLGQGLVSRQQAGDIWRSYMSRTRGLSDWSRITQEIPEDQRKLAFGIDILGANPRALRVGNQEALREDISTLTRDIARKMSGENPYELNRVLQNLGVRDTSEIFAALRGGKTVGTDVIPESVQKYLFQTQVLPSLKKAEFDIAGTSSAFSLTTGTMDEAVREIIEKGRSVTQQIAENVPNELIARQFNPEALSQLQQEFIDRNPVALAESLRTENIFRVLPRHGIGEEFVNRSFRDIIEQTGEMGEDVEQDVVWRLRKAAQNMTRQERANLTGLLVETKPDWLKSVLFGSTGKQIEAQVNAEVISDLSRTAGRAATSFKPGGLGMIGMDAAEFITKNPALVKRVGLLLGGGLALTAAYSALIPPQGPEKEDQTSQREGFGSTDNEMKKRDELVEQRDLKTKLIVRVSGTDPGGLDHGELVNSVHQALGSFFGKELRHSAETQDNRSKIDKIYLDKLAARLFKG